MTDPTTRLAASVADSPDAGQRPPRLLRRLLVLLLVAVVGPVVMIGYRWQQRLAFIESVESRRGSVRTERWGPEWLRDLVGAERMRGLERMRGIEIVHADDADLRMLYRQPLPDSLELVEPHFSAEVADQFHRLNGIRQLGFRKLEQHKAELLAQLQSFPALQRLTIIQSELTDEDLKLLAGITSLQHLDLQLSRFQQADLSHLRTLPNLHELNLRGTGITDSEAAAIGQLTQLDRHLNLSKNPITDRGLEQLESLTKLRGIALDSTDISDRGLLSLSNMSSLENVDLYDTDITDEGLPQLYHSSELKRLNVTGTAVTKEGSQQAKAALPACDVGWTHLLQKTLPK